MCVYVTEVCTVPFFDRKVQPLISRVPYVYFSLGELLLYNVVLTSAPQQCTYMHSLSGLAPTSTSHPSRSSRSAQLSSLCPTAFPPAVVQLLCHARVFAAPWTTACQALLSSAISKSLLRFMSIESVVLAS